MPKTDTQNEIVLKLPHGMRFTIWGSDCHVEFERGREEELANHLHHWVDCYIMSQVRKTDSPPAPESGININAVSKEEK